jgi:hypothetical protein
MIYDLRLATCDLRLAIYDLRLAIYDLRLAIYDLRLAIYGVLSFKNRGYMNQKNGERKVVLTIVCHHVKTMTFQSNSIVSPALYVFLSPVSGGCTAAGTSGSGSSPNRLVC